MQTNVNQKNKRGRLLDRVLFFFCIVLFGFGFILGTNSFSFRLNWKLRVSRVLGRDYMFQASCWLSSFWILFSSKPWKKENKDNSPYIFIEIDTPTLEHLALLIYYGQAVLHCTLVGKVPIFSHDSVQWVCFPERTFWIPDRHSVKLPRLPALQGHWHQLPKRLCGNVSVPARKAVAVLHFYHTGCFCESRRGCFWKIYASHEKNNNVVLLDANRSI